MPKTPKSSPAADALTTVIHVEALFSPREERALTRSVAPFSLFCPWCWKAAGRRFPAHEQGKVCAEHMTQLELLTPDPTGCS